MDASLITPQMVEQVEDLVGMGSGGWDFVKPENLIASAVAVAAPLVNAEAEAWRTVKAKLHSLLPFNEGLEFEHTTKLLELFVTIVREEQRLDQLSAALVEPPKPEGG